MTLRVSSTDLIDTTSCQAHTHTILDVTHHPWRSDAILAGQRTSAEVREDTWEVRHHPFRSDIILGGQKSSLRSDIIIEVRHHH
eukprot:231756-Rhodomonas_salina.1